MSKKYLLFLIPIFLFGCDDINSKDKFKVGDRTFYTKKKCVKFENKEVSGWHFGWSNWQLKYCWHYGKYTKDVCILYKTDTIEIK